MYQGLDKSGGGIVGSKESQLISIEFNEVCETTSSEEVLVCQEESQSGEYQKVFACAKINLMGH